MEILYRNIQQMNVQELEEECRELEDTYAEALKDNAGFDALSEIWKRIREAQKQLKENQSGSIDDQRKLLQNQSLQTKRYPTPDSVNRY